MKEASRLPRITNLSLVWEELVSKNPELQGFQRTQRALQDRLEEIKGALGSQGEIGAGIAKLHTAGANTDTVLTALALTVIVQEARSQRGHGLWEMRQKKRSLKSLAAKVRETAHEIEDTYSNPESHPDLWEVALRQVHNGALIPVAERVPKELLSQMQACADDLDVKALELGRLGKSVPPGFARESLVLLMDHIHLATGDIKPHFQILAEILAAAYDTFKIGARCPTGGSLEITFRRHTLLSPRLKR